MFKRKDNDIFGTASVTFAPRIANDSVIDPNASFRKQAERNYELYTAKLHPSLHEITHRPADLTKVNEEAQFQDDYHRNRKERDLESSIFYPPHPTNNFSRLQTSDTVRNSDKAGANFGRKETLSRQISGLPYNNQPAKGNSSRLFDLDDRVKVSSSEPCIPLIPHLMKWDQHDSVLYKHINVNPTKPNSFDIQESHSTVFQNQEDIPIQRKIQLKDTETLKQAVDIKQRPKTGKEANKNPVEMIIVKGWQPSLLQGLSKHCRLNATAVLQFQVDGSKGCLMLRRSGRWQNVVDWLRKEGKLKIRVVNP